MKKNHPQPKIKRIVITFCWDPPPSLIYTFPHHLQALKQASTVITSHPELTSRNCCYNFTTVLPVQALKQASTVITSHPELRILPEIATTTLILVLCNSISYILQYFQNCYYYCTTGASTQAGLHTIIKSHTEQYFQKLLLLLFY